MSGFTSYRTDLMLRPLAKVIGQVHARISMPSVDEQRQLQRENAEADALFWSSLQEAHEAQAAEQRELSVNAQRAASESESAAKTAAAKADRAKERLTKLDKGEDVSGGLHKARTRQDIEAMLLASGFTKGDIRRMDLIAKVGALGDDVWESFLRRVDMSMHMDRISEREARAILREQAIDID
jgi:hypothetical protein